MWDGAPQNVLVIAPAGEVHTPVMQAEWHVAHCVCQVHANFGADGMTAPRNAFNVEELAGVVLYA